MARRSLTPAPVGPPLHHAYSSHRHALQLGGQALLSLSFQTLGVVFSDIGTSPLYTLGGIWPPSSPAPPEEDVIGGISAIIWSLTLIPLVKYVCIALQFGTTEGEGGTFALYQGLFPPEEVEDDDERALTGDSAMLRGRSTQYSTEKLAPFKWLLLPWSLFGTSLVIADGIFTPAVSVTSAVGGIAVAKPQVLGSISLISIGFLLVFFFAQRFGVGRLAVAFAPVTFVWLLLIGGCGIYNITQHPAILRAFDPSRLIMFFVRTRNYDYLAGILLALTGCEAMFANLGQFNKAAIQLSCGFVVYPMLVLAYLGQGARLIKDGDAVMANIFYETIPGPRGGALYWIVYVVAILATLIASQALVTACFSLIQQLISLKSLPALKMIYTSETIQGQVYFPIVNWLLMIATVVVVAAFKNLANMTNAYGFAVSTVMFVTTTLIALQTYYTKHLHLVFALAFFLVFGFFDGLFWGASLRKVPKGAWVPLMIGGALTIIMVFWTWGKGLEDRFDSMNRRNLRHFVAPSNDDEKSQEQRLKVGMATLRHNGESSFGHAGPSEGEIQEKAPVDEVDEDASSQRALYLLQSDHEKRALSRLPTCAVFHKLTASRGVPHSFYAFLRQWPALPRVIIFLSVKTMNVNRIPPEERYSVTKVRNLPGFYGISYALGYRDNFLMQVNDIVDRICALESRIGVHEEATIARLIDEIRSAATRTAHIVPHYHVASKPVTKLGVVNGLATAVRSILLEGIYRRISTMFPESENWVGPADDVIRVGITAHI